MIKNLKKILFVICFMVLISKNVYTPVLVNRDIQENVKTRIFEIA